MRPRPHRPAVRRGSWRCSRSCSPAPLIGLARRGASRDAGATDSLPRGADSTQAAELRDALPAEDSSVAIVLWSAADGQLTADQLAALQEQATGLGTPAPLVPSEDGTAALAVVPVQAASATQNADLVGELRDRLRESRPDGVEVAVTGPAAVQADLAAVFDGANTRLLLVTAGVVALLLVITYRSPVLWLVPLTVVGVADRLAAVLATQLMALTGVAWDESTVGILSVLVFGAGTNYALLLISRYRDELRRHESRYDAMAVAVRRTAEAVLASATTVVLGLLTLLLSLVPTTRGLGLACAVGVVIAAAFVLLVLPAALVLFGRWVFWPRVPHAGDVPMVETHSVWRRVGDRVAARPSRVHRRHPAAGPRPVVRVARAADRARPGRPVPRTPPRRSRPRSGWRSRSRRAPPTRPQVLTRDDADAVLAAVTSTRRASAAPRSPQEGGGSPRSTPCSRPSPAPPTPSGPCWRCATRWRDSTTPTSAAPRRPTIDERSGAERDRWVILPLILSWSSARCCSCSARWSRRCCSSRPCWRRSSPASGASWWLFTGLLGFDALDVGVPLLAFLFLVALGVDYNIFLVTRAREEARRARHPARACCAR